MVTPPASTLATILSQHLLALSSCLYNSRNLCSFLSDVWPTSRRRWPLVQSRCHWLGRALSRSFLMGLLAVACADGTARLTCGGGQSYNVITFLWFWGVFLFFKIYFGNGGFPKCLPFEAVPIGKSFICVCMLQSKVLQLGKGEAPKPSLLHCLPAKYP